MCEGGYILGGGHGVCVRGGGGVYISGGIYKGACLDPARAGGGDIHVIESRPIQTYPKQGRDGREGGKSEMGIRGKIERGD